MAAILPLDSPDSWLARDFVGLQVRFTDILREILYC